MSGLWKQSCQHTSPQPISHLLRVPDLQRAWTTHLLAPLKSPSFLASHLSLLSSRGALRDFPTQMFPATLMCFSVHLHPGRWKPEPGPGSTAGHPPQPHPTPGSRWHSSVGKTRCLRVSQLTTLGRGTSERAQFLWLPLQRTRQTGLK